MKLRSIDPEIRDIRTNLIQIITESVDDTSPLTEIQMAGILNQIQTIRHALTEIEEINK